MRELALGFTGTFALALGPMPTPTATTGVTAAEAAPTLLMLRYLVQRRDIHCGKSGDEVSMLPLPHLELVVQEHQFERG